MITKSTPLFLFAISVSCLLAACNRDDDKDANTLQSSLTYECTNGVQKTHVSNNTTLSISCDNYGGCDANAKQCAKLPVLPDAPECTDNAYKCADSVRFVCDVPNWVAVEGCAHGCNAATNECNVPASGDCTDAQ